MRVAPLKAVRKRLFMPDIQYNECSLKYISSLVSVSNQIFPDIKVAWDRQTPVRMISG